MSPSEKWRDQRSSLLFNGLSSRFDEMRDLLQQFADTGFTLPQDATWLNGMTEYAEAAIACGDPRFARLLFELLEPFAEQFSSTGGVTAEGPVANCLGGLATILGRYEDAERFFTLASSFATRYDARFFGAQTDLLWGQMLAQRGPSIEEQRVREFLDRALSVVRAHGYGGVERRAVATLQQLSYEGARRRGTLPG